VSSTFQGIDASVPEPRRFDHHENAFGILRLFLASLSSHTRQKLPLVIVPTSR
jgi:hypothetical protein